MTRRPGSGTTVRDRDVSARTRAQLLPARRPGRRPGRATAEQVAAFADFGRPRALVVIGANAAVDTALLTALVGDVPAPVVTGTSLPSWVGPLDIVVVLASVGRRHRRRRGSGAGRPPGCPGVRPGRRRRSGRRGRRRLRAAGPMVPVTEALAGAARLTVLIGVAAAAGFGAPHRTSRPRPTSSTRWRGLPPVVGVLRQPGADAGRAPVRRYAVDRSGTDPVADALAGYTCRALAALAGYAGAPLLSYQAAGSPPVLASAARTDGPAGTFYDPYLDETPRQSDVGQTVSSVLVVGPSAHGRRTSPAGAGLLPWSPCRRSDPSRSTRCTRQRPVAAGRRVAGRVAPGDEHRAGGAAAAASSRPRAPVRRRPATRSAGPWR